MSVSPKAAEAHDASVPQPIERSQAPVDPDELLRVQDAARLLNLSVRSLERMRAAGIGPRWVKCSPKILRYPRSEIRAWAQSQTFERIGQFEARNDG